MLSEPAATASGKNCTRILYVCATAAVVMTPPGVNTHASSSLETQYAVQQQYNMATADRGMQPQPLRDAGTAVHSVNPEEAQRRLSCSYLHIHLSGITVTAGGEASGWPSFPAGETGCCCCSALLHRGRDSTRPGQRAGARTDKQTVANTRYRKYKLRLFVVLPWQRQWLCSLGFTRREVVHTT